LEAADDILLLVDSDARKESGMMNLEDAIQSEEYQHAMKIIDDISLLVRKGSSELSRELYVFMIAILEARTHATLDHIAGRSMEEAGLVAQARLLAYMESIQGVHVSNEIDFLRDLAMQANGHAVDPEKCVKCEKRETCPMYINYLSNSGDTHAQEVN